MLPLIALNIVRFNQAYPLLEKCICAALDQDLEDFTVTLTDNGSADSIREPVLAQFGSSPRFRYVENHTNLGFAGAHNRFFSQTRAEFVMPLNPDAVLSRNYLTLLIRAFDDPLVAAAEGKMIKPEPAADGNPILDGTGMVMSRSRRAHERGQLEADHGQYDKQIDIFGVSATAAAYRKSALETVKHGDGEYFDEDFFTYWEDLDLSWRLRLAGFKCTYVPGTVVYHSRAAGQSKEGFRQPRAYFAHTQSISTRILQWDWRNHLFSIIKNDFGWSFFRDLPIILTREAALFLYLSLCEPRALGAIPEFGRLLPRILRKRKMIQCRRQVHSKEMARWFGKRYET